MISTLPPKAQQLINTTSVHIEHVRGGDVTARVQDLDRNGPYLAEVTRRDGQWRCSCPYGSPEEGRPCVHISSVAVVTEPIG